MDVRQHLSRKALSYTCQDSNPRTSSLKKPLYDLGEENGVRVNSKNPAALGLKPSIPDFFQRKKLSMLLGKSIVQVGGKSTVA